MPSLGSSAGGKLCLSTNQVVHKTFSQKQDYKEIKMENKKYDIWPERYKVHLIAEEYENNKNVVIHLFQHNMPEEEAIGLLKLLGITENESSDIRNEISQVSETFNDDQVVHMINYFSKCEGYKIELLPACIPNRYTVGLSDYPVGYLGGFKKFYEEDDYRLGFEVCGYFDLDLCEKSARKKVESTKNELIYSLRNDHLAWLLFMKEITDPNQDWVIKQLLSHEESITDAQSMIEFTSPSSPGEKICYENTADHS
jgi:hypothetical protein